MGGLYGCGCGVVVRRYIYIYYYRFLDINYPYSCICFFGSSIDIPTFVLKGFCFLIMPLCGIFL